ncbi:hypothetical protein FRX31_022906, partial [Thalictrum thalictroides]
MAGIPFGFGGRSNQCLFSREVVNSSGVSNRNEVRFVDPLVEKPKAPSFATVASIPQLKVGRDVDLSSLPMPSKHGSFPTVKLAKADVLKGLDECKWALVGRLDFSKTNILKVRAEIDLKWKLKESCKAIPLGR